MLVEVCFLLDASGTVLWADRSDDPAALPDSRTRWEAIWRHRAELAEIAHSHPRGPLRFSTEDETTMAAVDAALGRRLRYAVVTPDAVLRADPAAPDGPDVPRRPGGAERPHQWHTGQRAVVSPEPAWAARLRAASGLSDRRETHVEEQPGESAPDGGSERHL